MYDFTNILSYVKNIDTYVCNIWVCMYDFASKYINTALLKSFMFDKV